MATGGKISFMVLLLLGLPLLGVALTGQPLAPYLEFPPLPRSVEHAPFSWPVFAALAAFVLAVTLPVLLRVIRTQPLGPAARPNSAPFPWWGWAGVVLGGLAWLVAWTRFPGLAAVQSFTFTPLWVSYILVINALTFRRTGHCMLRDAPRSFLALFPLSAAFWWFFEYLNRFVQNWYYLEVSAFAPLEYALSATVAFSTVLPAVLGTADWLQSFPRLDAAFRQYRPLRLRRTKHLGWIVLLLAAAGLTGIGVWPDYLFPLLWIAPLLVIISLQMISGEPSIFSGLPKGDWRLVVLPALAGLCCGFFWELWNSQSLAHWEYSVPFVHRFCLFEMPLLGYAGYLPFGMECAAIAQWALRWPPSAGLTLSGAPGSCRFR